MTTEQILQLLSFPVLAIALGFAVWNIWTGIKWLMEQRRKRGEEKAKVKRKD